MSSATTDTPTPAPDAPSTPDNCIHLDCMIIEAGIIVNSLSCNDAGKALAAKIVEAADAAWAKLDKDVILDMTPFEAGLALDALSGGASNVTSDLINRIYTLLNDMMNALGITALPGEPSDPVSQPEESDAGDEQNSADGDDISVEGGAAPADGDQAAEPTGDAAPEDDATGTL